MNDIKHAIGILCEHLNHLYGTNLKPEHFRLAKFNKTEENVVPCLWNAINKFNKEPMGLDVVNNAKLFLYKLKYKSLYFYCLSEDMSDGSRELLLALGFLLAKRSLDDIVFEKARKTPFNPEFNIHRSPMHKEITFNETLLKTDKDRNNAIKWIEGKLNSNKRMIQELEQQTESMVSQLNNTVNISNVPKLSLNEIMALKKKDYARDFLRTTENVITILENHEKWIKKEKVFWQWMNTVTAERDKNENEIDFECLERFFVISNMKQH